MGVILLGGAFLVFTIVLLIIIPVFWSSEKRFRKNSVQCNAIIVGYAREDYTRWDTPQVVLETDGKNAILQCKSKRMNASVCPKGTQVRVEYYKSKFFGSEFFDVRMVDPKFAPEPASTALIILCALAAVFLTVSIVLFMIGIDSL